MKPATQTLCSVKSGRPKTIQNAYPSKTLKKYQSWPPVTCSFFSLLGVGSPQTLYVQWDFRSRCLPTSGNTTHRDLGLELQCGTCAARDSHLMGFWWIVKNPVVNKACSTCAMSMWPILNNHGLFFHCSIVISPLVQIICEALAIY